MPCLRPLTAPDAAEGELLDNPDFEDGSYPLQSPDGADISGAMANGGWNDNSDWVPGVSLRCSGLADCPSCPASLALQNW
jgi:hypothetical protein